MDAMTKGQRNLLLFLLGVVILFVPIRFVALSNFDDRKELVSKKDEQQVYYNSLKATYQPQLCHIPASAH